MLGRLRRFLFGKPRDLTKPEALQRVSLVALLAWVGLGADGLSSTAYGPAEAFRALGAHKGLAVFLALAIAVTVFVISYGYSRIIEQFPGGGGGYLVASKILGPRIGVISGAALLVDYVLTIAISSAAGTDAVLSFLSGDLQQSKVLLALVGILILSLANMRGMRVLFVTPIFVAFLVTHVAVVALAVGGHALEIPELATRVGGEVRSTAATLGLAGTLHLIARAYALGGGTYTGIEAVSNGVHTLAEPKVETAQRTMFLMATSLAFMASGIVVAYLLLNVGPEAGKTMNAVLIERVSYGWRIGGFEIGNAFLIIALLSEAAILFIAAQAGLVDGPRVMANMANDSWLPHRFAALSDRLTMRNGVTLMALAAAAAVIYTRGSVEKLVIVYAINVFITFTLSNVSMVIYWFRHRFRAWKRHTVIHGVATLLSGTILVIATYEKLSQGGWVTLVTTLGVVALCMFVQRHYQLVGWAIDLLDVEFPGPEVGMRAKGQYQDLLGEAPPGEPDPAEPTAILFVGGYSPLGRKTLVTLLRTFPGHFKGVIFVSIAVVDTGIFKGIHKLRDLEERAREALDRYQDFAAMLGLRSMAVTATGAEVPAEAEKVIRALVERYPKATVVGGQLNFEDDTLWHRLLHNETAFLIQRRLQYLGIPMVVLPTQLESLVGRSVALESGSSAGAREVTVEERRPTPEEMLARAAAESAPTRGRFKIFFGAAPGVGKTYAMLEAARARKREGIDVVIGWVETHGRKETEALIAGLEHVPAQEVLYRGISLKELDLDAALARRPQLLLVDELAHTNAPGVRHAKRWQDVEDLLDAGIDVYSTLNVQHMESVNDVVAEITGVVVKETVPDSIVERADEIELVDLSPEDLQERLRQGKVYLPGQAARAVQSFFQKGNLIALRELALRRTAEHVDADAAEWKRAHGVREVWATRERILVAIGPGAQSANLIRTAFRMATTARAPWLAMSVETPALEVLPAEERNMVAQHLELAERLGAETLVVHGERIIDEILAVARERNVTRIVVGKPTEERWWDRLRRSIVRDLVRKSGPIDVVITTGEDSPEIPEPRRPERPHARLRHYLVAMSLVLASSAIGFALRSRLDFSDELMIHLFGVLLAASRLARAPSLVAALAAAAMLALVFVPATERFSLMEVRYNLAFALLAFAALFVSSRTQRIREQAEIGRQRERRTAALYAMSKDLLMQTEVEEIARTALHHAQDSLQTEAALLLPDPGGELVSRGGDRSRLMSSDREVAVARWVFEHGRAAGRGTTTLPACEGLYLPMIGTRMLGVFGIALARRGAPLTPLQSQLLETLVAQTALALERALLSEQATGARVSEEAGRLRSALIGALSADLRTPLAAIRRSASEVLEREDLGAPERAAAESIRRDADRLTELVADLFELGSIESGMRVLEKRRAPLEAIVEAALLAEETALSGHEVALDLPAGLEVEVDAALFEEALAQILDNAAKYSPPKTPIQITAQIKRTEVEIEIGDRGPGLPIGEEEKAFERFYRGGAQPAVRGSGLGLTIVRAIVTAHGGIVRAANRPDGGAAFTVRIPRG